MICGCDDALLNEDHYHQYLNAFGATKNCWYVDREVFFSSLEATYHVKQVLGCDIDEALVYVRDLPKKYN